MCSVLNLNRFLLEGSGKTAAFVLPLVAHIRAQRPLRRGEGPIGVIVAPTRELCLQIYNDVRKFARPYKFKSLAIYGGASKHEQSMALKKKEHEILVCTPGRFIDMLKSGAVSPRRITYLVLDEADRMFDLGFEPQVRRRSTVGPAVAFFQHLTLSILFPHTYFMVAPCKGSINCWSNAS